jgi:hypothetical protein
MTTKHTPGPWLLQITGPNEMNHDTFVIRKMTQTIFGNIPISIMRFDAVQDNSETDARIIASAPELLETLKDVRNFLQNYLDGHRAVMSSINIKQFQMRIDYADRSIAKAEGTK